MKKLQKERMMNKRTNPLIFNDNQRNRNYRKHSGILSSIPAGGYLDWSIHREGLRRIFCVVQLSLVWLIIWSRAASLLISGVISIVMSQCHDTLLALFKQDPPLQISTHTSTHTHTHPQLILREWSSSASVKSLSSLICVCVWKVVTFHGVGCQFPSSSTVVSWVCEGGAICVNGVEWRTWDELDCGVWRWDGGHCPAWHRQTPCTSLSLSLSFISGTHMDCDWGGRESSSDLCVAAQEVGVERMCEAVPHSALLSVLLHAVHLMPLSLCLMKHDDVREQFKDTISHHREGVDTHMISFSSGRG